MDTHSQILLIKDDPAVARSLQDGLQHYGFQVTWQSSGGPDWITPSRATRT